MEGINCESTQQIWEVVSISCRTLVRAEKTCREKEEEEIQSVFGLYMLEGCKNYTGGSRQQFQSLHKMIQHIKTKSTCWMLPLWVRRCCHSVLACLETITQEKERNIWKGSAYPPVYSGNCLTIFCLILMKVSGMTQTWKLSLQVMFMGN